MSSNTVQIDGFHPTVPILRAPTQNPAREEEVFLNVPKGKKTSLPLGACVKEIPHQCLEFFKDEEWMSLIVDFFGIASRSLELAGNAAGKYVPYLSIISSPFYLYHALKNSKERFQLMYSAAKTSRVADAFFWFARAVDSTGTALSNITKPFAGGFELGGLTPKHFALGVTFTFVIPIILIVFGAIGGFSKGWAMIRTQKVLKRFNKEADKQDGSLKALAGMLEYLQGPQLVSMSPKEFALEERHFNENHFTNAQRREAVQARVYSLLGHHDLHKIRLSIERIVSHDVEEAIHPVLDELGIQEIERIPELESPLVLLQDIQSLQEKLVTESATEFSLLDETLVLYKRLLAQIDETQVLYEEIQRNHDELEVLKEEILREGGEIIGTVRSEIHRKLCYHAAFILMAALTLTAGVLLLYAKYSHIGYGLALASSSLNLIYILFEKMVSQESFYKMDHYIQKLLDKKSEPSVQ